MNRNPKTKAKTPKAAESAKVENAWISPTLSWQYWLLLGACVAQALTVMITWQTWMIRQFPVALPLFADGFWDHMADVLPPWTYGAILLASLLVVPFSPRVGCWIHLVVLAICCVADQFRMQPQFLFLALMIVLLSLRSGTTLARWVLISLWLWAGLHKLLSPEWLGSRSFAILEKIEWSDPEWYLAFGLAAGIAEVAVALVALRFHRVAAVFGLAMHLGIVAFLSPLGINHNYSVIPWNLFVGLSALLLFWNQPTASFPRRINVAFASVVMLYPAFFYLGWIDHGISFVLYSGMIPQARITQNVDAPIADPVHGAERGWGLLRIPFPDERRTLIAYFRRAASEGSKLHLFDPRWSQPDQFYVKTSDGVERISEPDFFAQQPGCVVGEPFDNPVSIFQLVRKGHELLGRYENAPVYAVRMNPQTFSADDLQHLAGLRGIEQLQLANCRVSDSDLAQLPILFHLQGIGVSNTALTDQSLRYLSRLPNLQMLEVEGTEITPAAAADVGIEAYR